MKVSKNSWHYKLLTKGVFGFGFVSRHKVRQDLCRYFWQVAGTIFGTFVLFLVIIPLVVGGFVVVPLSELVAWIVTGTYVSGTPGFALGIAPLVMLILITVGLIVGYIKKRVKAVSAHSEPNLAVEWVKAKKSKVCPSITFVDEG